MPETIIILMVLIGAAIPLGLMKFVPFTKALLKPVEMVLGLIAALLLVGLALGAVGYPWLLNLVSGVEWLYALVVGLLGGTVISGIFKF